MRSLPRCFTVIADSRRSQGRRHRLPVVLGIAAGAILCGMRGYKAIADWAYALGQKARERSAVGVRTGSMSCPANLSFAIAWCVLEPGRWIGRSMTGTRRGGGKTMHWHSMARP